MPNKPLNQKLDNKHNKDLQDKQQLENLMDQLNTQIDKLIAYLASDQKLNLVGFETQPVSQELQNKALAKGQSFIEVKAYNNKDKHHVLNHFKRFYAAHKASTRFVSRMPGVLNCQLPAEKVIGLVKHINELKDQIKTIVQTGRNHNQRHEFIHDAMPSVMTEQLYRHIHCTQMPIKSLWFGWRLKRQTNNSLTHQQAIDLLHKHMDKPKGEIDTKQWQAMINTAINDIRNTPNAKLQQQRQYKTHPTCAYSFYTSEQQLKRGKISIAMPWILLSQASEKLPVRTPLKSFNSKEHSAQNQAKPQISIFEPLKLIDVNL